MHDGCPFFVESKKLTIFCEGGSKWKMAYKEFFREKMDQHCMNSTGWRDCTLAPYLEKMEEMEKVKPK